MEKGEGWEVGPRSKWVKKHGIVGLFIGRNLPLAQCQLSAFALDSTKLDNRKPGPGFTHVC